MPEGEAALIVGRKALAKKLGVSPDMISELVRKGTIPVLRFMKKKWAFRWADVETALQASSHRGELKAPLSPPSAHIHEASRDHF